MRPVEKGDRSPPSQIVEPGDMLIYRTAGGGGWKDRLDRPVAAFAPGFGGDGGAGRVQVGGTSSRSPKRPDNSAYNSFRYQKTSKKNRLMYQLDGSVS